ncbi:truA [Symbiodinium natans]|uniref:tRNA pseudouridine synthase n=1 Tax=Symbiodinium natans TaxID=878477 RepID=A0A812S2Z1_9DINO|nr:truA [Symbiodinium natans]
MSSLTSSVQMRARRQRCGRGRVVVAATLGSMPFLACLAFAKTLPAERSREAAQRKQYGDLLRLVKTRGWPQKSPELSTDLIGVDEALEGAERRSLVSPGFRRLRFRASYDGSQYNGWARVKNASPLTVAGILDRAMSLLLRQKIFSCGASRTDAGVHARGQAAHFDVPDAIVAERPSNWQELWEKRVNEQLPSDIRIWSFQDAPPDFHATFSASGKTYVYRLHYGTNAADPLQRFYRYQIPAGWARTFDGDLLRAAASKFIGEKDFRYFTQTSKLDRYRIAGTVRTIRSLNVVEEGPGACRIEVNLDGAIFRMVRNIVGCIVMAACGRLAVDRIDELLQASPDKAKQDTMAPALAFPCLPPHGLCLEKVHYDSQDF